MMTGISNSYYNNYNEYTLPSATANRSSKSEEVQGVSSPFECQTCSSRKYQDGSNENVSFKSPGKISPETSASVVRSHEGEHVKNAYAKASSKNGEVVSATVSLQTATCPECGKAYVSGGTTNTSIRYTNESNPYQQQKKAMDALAFIGMNINYGV